MANETIQELMDNQNKLNNLIGYNLELRAWKQIEIELDIRGYYISDIESAIKNEELTINNFSKNWYSKEIPQDKKRDRIVAYYINMHDTEDIFCIDINTLERLDIEIKEDGSIEIIDIRGCI